MKRFSFLPTLASGVVVAAALVSSSGCASPSAKDTVDSMGTFGTEMAKGKDSIDNTIKALEALPGAQGDDIKVRFETYSKALAALDEQATVIRDHADQMKANGDAYFTEWEDSANVSPERGKELSASYARIKEDMAQAKERITPFLLSLKDIQSYLNLDLSRKGIDSVSTLVQKAKREGAQVKASMDAVLAQVNSVRGMISTKEG